MACSKNCNFKLKPRPPTCILDMSVAAFGRQNLFYRKTIGRILTGTRECYCNRSSRIYDVIKVVEYLCDLPLDRSLAHLFIIIGNRTNDRSTIHERMLIKPSHSNYLLIIYKPPFPNCRVII